MPAAHPLRRAGRDLRRRRGTADAEEFRDALGIGPFARATGRLFS